jgi:sugar lactone lactonase YvrE
MTVVAKGVLDVSDSRTKKIHRIEGTAVPTLVEGLKGPNGLLAHEGRFYVLDSGTLLEVQTDKSLKMVADGMEASTDGVEPIKGGGFVVTSWSGVLYHVGADGSKHVLFDGRPTKTNSADLGFDPETKTLYVPTFFKNTVIAYELR